MTQPNQSKLEQELDELLQSPSYGVTLFAGHRDVLVSHIVRYITANYTPNSEVEQLKSRIAWLEGKIEGLSNDNLTPHLTPHLTPKKLPRFEP